MRSRICTESFVRKYMHASSTTRIEESSSPVLHHWRHQSCAISTRTRNLFAVSSPSRVREDESSLAYVSKFLDYDYDSDESRLNNERNNEKRLDPALVGIFWNHFLLFTSTWTGQDVTRYDDEEHLKAAGKYLPAFNGKPYPSSEPGQVFERAWGTVCTGGGEERSIQENTSTDEQNEIRRERKWPRAPSSLPFYTFKNYLQIVPSLRRLVFEVEITSV